MEKLILDVSVVEKLRTVRASAELCDPEGRIVGVFTPTEALSTFEVEDPPSDEELKRIDSNFQGRPLGDILHSLEAES
jgi:hypothetical protein